MTTRHQEKECPAGGWNLARVRAARPLVDGRARDSELIGYFLVAQAELLDEGSDFRLGRLSNVHTGFSAQILGSSAAARAYLFREKRHENPIAKLDILTSAMDAERSQREQ